MPVAFPSGDPLRDRWRGQRRRGGGAVRAALSRLFERFIVRRGAPESAHVELIGEVWIELVERPRRWRGTGSRCAPCYAGEPLYEAEKNQSVGSATPRLFGPIPMAD